MPSRDAGTVYNSEERIAMLTAMKRASDQFYQEARSIGCHPFIEFTGLMNEYIKACQRAHENGIDFTQCSTHSGQDLPMAPYQVDYVNEKLECIFTGRSVVSGRPEGGAGSG
jgi:hypothetical protein